VSSILFLVGGGFLAFAVFLLPAVVFAPGKFALAFTLGSIAMVGATAVLRGPRHVFREMTAAERLPFSIAYTGSVALSLYASLAQSYLLVLAAALAQLVALLWYLATFIPGGTAGLQRICQAACGGFGRLVRG
jgi:hypothetical protein